MTDEEDFSVNLASIEIPSFNINRELFNELSFRVSSHNRRSHVTVSLIISFNSTSCS